MNWDLLNDGMGNPKNVKSLLLCFQTPPVMSLGVRSDASVAIRAGIRHILFTTPREDVASAMRAAVAALAPELEGGYLRVCALDTSRMSATDGTRDGIVLLPFYCIPLDP